MTYNFSEHVVDFRGVLPLRGRAGSSLAVSEVAMSVVIPAYEATEHEGTAPEERCHLNCASFQFRVLSFVLFGPRE